MRFEGGVVRGTVDVFWTLQFLGTPKVIFQLAQLPLLSGPALAGLGLAGMLAASLSVRRDRAALALLPALVFALLYAAIAFSWHAKFVRYLLPLTPVLDPLRDVALRRPAAQRNARRLRAHDAGARGDGRVGRRVRDHLRAARQPARGDQMACGAYGAGRRRRLRGSTR